MKKVCFLFGAGVEGEDNYNLPNGTDFMKKSFLDEDLKDALTDALKNHFQGSYFSDSYRYSIDSYLVNSTFRSILKKWINQTCTNIECYNRYASDIQQILNKDELKDLLSSIGFEEGNSNPAVQNKNDKISGNGDTLIKIFRSLFSSNEAFNRIEAEKNIEGCILEMFVSKISDNNVTFIPGLETSISHILDGHFHTIINPQKFGRVKFSRVFNYYWSIFFAIYAPIVEQTRGAAVTNFEQELRFLKENIKLLYDDSTIFGSSSRNRKLLTYYESIVQEFQEIPITGVITSNYFKFAEIINRPIAYLNGQLRLFEIPETLEVIDITKTNLPKDKLYFPFIMGQSYTKPIISRHQIDAFKIMGDILEEANILVILGYNVNEDDNHINAYLRDFMLSGYDKHIIVDNDKESALRKRLKLTDSVGSVRGIKMKTEKIDLKNGIKEDTWNSPLSIIQSIKNKVEEIARAK